MLIEPRKARAASIGVAKLMKSLKPKKKGLIDKGKSKQNKTGFFCFGRSIFFSLFMKMLIWNVRGFNHPLKQREVVGRIKRLNINFACLLKTRVKQYKLQKIINQQFLGWKLFHNYSEVPNGRIWVLWNGDMQIDLVALIDKSITCRI